MRLRSAFNLQTNRFTILFSPHHALIVAFQVQERDLSIATTKAAELQQELLSALADAANKQASRHLLHLSSAMHSLCSSARWRSMMSSQKST
jgi:hypothetical protein